MVCNVSSLNPLEVRNASQGPAPASGSTSTRRGSSSAAMSLGSAPEHAASRSIGYDGQPLLLGRGRQNGTANFFLQGRIDEAAVYNRVLSAAEIAAIYNAGAAGKHL